MNLGRYAPSAQFTGIAFSVLLAGGLIFGAERLSNPSAQATITSKQTTPSADSTDWEAALYASQAANASTSITAPNPNMVNQFLAAAQSPNLTDTVGRTLLINISNAKSQGLGSDIPTQTQIIAAATAQMAKAQAPLDTYAYADLNVVAASKTSLHTYGNAVMQTLDAQPNASEQATLLAIDEIVEGGDKTQSATLMKIGAAYKAIALGLLATPVPQTLAPLHLQAVNNFLALGQTYNNMSAVGTDSVRGLAGLQSYESLMNANARLFISIAQELQKSGILFTKDEPGNSWSVLLPTSALAPQ